jgi:hypothetical protein
VSRSTLVSLVFRTLIAMPVFCASFAAYSGSLELSALIKEPQAGCDEKASFPSADEQQADQTIRASRKDRRRSRMTVLTCLRLPVPAQR